MENIHLGSLNFQLLKPSTKYLVVFENVIVPSYINISFKTQMDTELVSSYGKLSSGMDRVTITTTSEMSEANQILYARVSNEKTGHFELKNVAIYEYVNGMENWDKSMFSFEPEIKSLGESTNNSITVENNLVEEGTYVHELQNHILPTHPEVTHVTWGEDVVIPPEVTNNSITVENNLVEEGTYVHELQNHILPTHPEVTHVTWGEDVVIPPEVEIELKNGEEVVQTITQLPVKLETTGEEKLHNNSITVENNLVEEGTYVHELQNHILPTHPEVTHVTWGEDVVIPPEVEIELKNGEEVVQTITQLPVKLETTGEEKLHVKTMKGQTLVNLLYDYSSTNNYEVEINHQNIIGKVLIKNLYKGAQCYINRFDIATNTYKGASIITSNNFIIEIPEGQYVRSVYDNNQIITADELIENGMIIKYQDGMENWDIPYFEGMQSVKVPVLKTTGKNLFNVTKSNGYYSYSNGNWVNDVGFKTLSAKVLPNTKYTQNIERNNVTFWNNGIFVSGIANSPTFTTPTNCNEVRVSCLTNFETFMLEEGEITTTYEPYKSNILSTPENIELREIGDVQDTLDLLTGEVTERIGEIVLDGSEDWEYTSETFRSRIISNKVFEQLTPSDREKIYLICDKYKSIAYSASWNSGEFIALHISKQIVFRDERFANTQDWKQYLSQNPLTVQYQLATESIKTVDLTEDDYVGKSKVTYQLAEPLNYIPNGAYDEIKGDKLIKRTNKIYLDGTETWSSFRDETNTTHRISLPMEDGKPSSVCMSSHYEYGTGSTVEKVKIYMTVNANLSITVLKSDFPTVDSFKTWLSNNRPMVIYELANPIEIPLKEVSPLECDFSLNRQFKRGYDNCLKELPNGVKDVVENGKVTRRIANTTIDGSENWIHYGGTTNNTDTENTLVFMLESCSKLNTRKSGKNNYLCKTLSILEEGVHIPDVEKSGVWLHSDSQYYNFVYIRVFKNWLPTPDVDGLKKWLNKNPLEILFEVQTPTTEELTEENCRYVPYMPLNSYVGSLYVADGINRTKFLTDFSPSEYEVQTSHRYFSNEFNMFEDITLKKSPYGHKTYLEEVDGKYVEKFIAGLEKHEIEDLRHKVSLTGFDYSQLLQDSFLKLIKGELS